MSPGFIPQLLISIRHRRSRIPAVRLILSTMLVHSWGEIEGAGVEPRWRGVVEWKGVQSISRKSVCTARSPNAATLSSYSFDRNPLSLCTQSLMALFKDRNRSMSSPRASAKKEYECANPVKNYVSLCSHTPICYFDGNESMASEI